MDHVRVLCHIHSSLELPLCGVGMRHTALIPPVHVTVSVLLGHRWTLMDDLLCCLCIIWVEIFPHIHLILITPEL